jgi:hypothetical protein
MRSETTNAIMRVHDATHRAREVAGSRCIRSRDCSRAILKILTHDVLRSCRDDSVRHGARGVPRSRGVRRTEAARAASGDVGGGNEERGCFDEQQATGAGAPSSAPDDTKTGRTVELSEDQLAEWERTGELPSCAGCLGGDVSTPLPRQAFVPAMVGISSAGGAEGTTTLGRSPCANRVKSSGLNVNKRERTYQSRPAPASRARWAMRSSRSTL